MIKTLILKSGLEVIADVEELPSALSGAIETYRLKKPFKIETAFVPMENGLAAATQMVPLLVSSIQSTIELPSSDIMLVLDTAAKFEAAYVKRTTGLELARA